MQIDRNFIVVLFLKEYNQAWAGADVPGGASSRCSNSNTSNTDYRPEAGLPMLVSSIWLVIGDLRAAVLPELHRGHQTVYQWCIATG